MPSTLELVRLTNYLQSLTPQSRNQFFTNTVALLESTERDTVKANELQDFNQFISDLKNIQGKSVDSTWTHELFRRNGNNGYFLRFLQRIPQK